MPTDSTVPAPTDPANPVAPVVPAVTPSNVIPFPPQAPVADSAPAQADPAALPEVAPAVDSATPSNVVPFPPQAPVAPAGAKKILVVEDEPDARTMFMDLLSGEGYDVSSAVDGVDAIAKSAAEKYDLILLDIVMPNKDGLEVLEEIKADTMKYGTPTVVMLTNISGDAAVEKAKELGAVDFLLKIGTEPDALIQSVRDYLSGKLPTKESQPNAPLTMVA